MLKAPHLDQSLSNSWSCGRIQESDTDKELNELDLLNLLYLLPSQSLSSIVFLTSNNSHPAISQIKYLENDRNIGMVTLILN
jgi:hypothetical protein